MLRWACHGIAAAGLTFGLGWIALGGIGMMTGSVGLVLCAASVTLMFATEEVV